MTFMGRNCILQIALCRSYDDMKILYFFHLGKNIFTNFLDALHFLQNNLLSNNIVIAFRGKGKQNGTRNRRKPISLRTVEVMGRKTVDRGVQGMCRG